MVTVFFLILKHCAGAEDLHPHRPERAAAPGGADDAHKRPQKRGPDEETLLPASHFSIWDGTRTTFALAACEVGGHGREPESASDDADTVTIDLSRPHTSWSKSHGF